MTNIALIGAGSMAKNYINTLDHFPNARISIVLAKTKNNLSKLPGKFIKTTKIEDVLIQKNIDAVIISSPASTHFKFISLFQKMGIRILVEKPFVTSLNEVKKIKKTKPKSNILIAHTLLFHPAYQLIKKLVKNEKILNLRFEGYNNNPRKDTTLLWDWGPHPISLFLDLYNKMPKSANLENKSKNEISISLDFGNNLKSSFRIGWNSPKKIRKLEVSTNKNIYIFDDLKYPNLEINSLSGFNISYPKVETTPPLNNLISYFLRSGRYNTSNFDFGVKLTKILEACNKSIKNRTTKL